MNAPAADGATSVMAVERAEIPNRVERQRREHAAAYRDVGACLRSLAPPVVATVARGSSDHAATYLKCLVELGTGTPVSSLAPSVASIYKRSLRLHDGACIAISQSGRSPDLVAAVAMAHRSGARCFAITNDPSSPVVEDGRAVAVPIGAGPERAVAATKSFTGSLVAIASVVAAWSDDPALESALDALPAVLSRSLAGDWTEALEAVSTASSVYVIGRGPSFGIACEAALKLKETCGVHAEAYSAAEVLHGPLQLASSAMVGIIFASDDESRASVEETAVRLARSGARVFVADPVRRDGGPAGPATSLAVARTGHPWLDAISQITTFYGLAETLSRRLGLDPDRPSRLSKVTETR